MYDQLVISILRNGRLMKQVDVKDEPEKIEAVYQSIKQNELPKDLIEFRG